MSSEKDKSESSVASDGYAGSMGAPGIDGIGESTWKVECDNDTGPDDGGFWEWWMVTNGTTEFKCDSASNAEWLCNLLNQLTTTSA